VCSACIFVCARVLCACATARKRDRDTETRTRTETGTDKGTDKGGQTETETRSKKRERDRQWRREKEVGRKRDGDREGARQRERQREKKEKTEKTDTCKIMNAFTLCERIFHAQTSQRVFKTFMKHKKPLAVFIYCKMQDRTSISQQKRHTLMYRDDVTCIIDYHVMYF
jgi:hypothetical protein